MVLLVSPQISESLEFVRLTILGGDFQRGMTRHAVKLVQESSPFTEISSDDVDVRNDNGLAAEFDLEGRPVGTYSIDITNPDGGNVRLAGAFQIFVNGSGGSGASVVNTKATKRTRSRGANGHRRGAIAGSGSKRRGKS